MNALLFGHFDFSPFHRRIACVLAVIWMIMPQDRVANKLLACGQTSGGLAKPSNSPGVPISLRLKILGMLNRDAGAGRAALGVRKPLQFRLLFTDATA